MMRLEFQVLVCVCRFPVDSDANGVVTIPLDECVQEWELGVLFSFYGKLCLGVKALTCSKKSCRLYPGIIEKTSSIWLSQTFDG